MILFEIHTCINRSDICHEWDDKTASTPNAIPNGDNHNHVRSVLKLMFVILTPSLTVQG